MVRLKWEYVLGKFFFYFWNVLQRVEKKKGVRVQMLCGFRNRVLLDAKRSRNQQVNFCFYSIFVTLPKLYGRVTLLYEYKY